MYFFNPRNMQQSLHFNSFIIKNDKLKGQAINGTKNMTCDILQDKQLRILRVNSIYTYLNSCFLSLSTYLEI